MNKDPFQTLGIGRDADEDAVKRAYRSLAPKYHPDVPGGSNEAFMELTAAKDCAIALVAERAMLEAVPGPIIPGEDISIDLTLTLEESVLGCVKELIVPSRTVTCPKCDGTGKNPKASAVPCVACMGRKYAFDSSSTLRPCKMCNGTGEALLICCDECKGIGKTQRDVQIRVKLPPGVKTGDEVKFPSQGLPGVNAPSGDLYVNIRQKRHDKFIRKGDDLMVDKTLSLAEFLGGVSFSMDVPGHGSVEVEVPAGFPSGKDVAISGKGVGNIHTGVSGDLRVRIFVKFPKRVSARARMLITELVDELKR